MIMKTFVTHLPVIAVAAILATQSAHAQGYPQVPSAIMEAARVENAAAKKLSDEAFTRALPEIEAWATKGKPYLPGAAKPEDLPQAKIPAFPGAWGGGMYRSEERRVGKECA